MHRLRQVSRQRAESRKDVRLYEAIGNLVQMGKVNERAQKALDAVRVKGSSLLHPGQIELADTTTIANQLFMLANLIVREAIEIDKHLDAMYRTLTDEQLAYIEKRDKRSS